MILCDPFAINTLSLSTVRHLQELVGQETLPRVSAPSCPHVHGVEPQRSCSPQTPRAASWVEKYVSGTGAEAPPSAGQPRPLAAAAAAGAGPGGLGHD